MTSRFQTVLGVLALVAVAIVVGLIIYSDAVSDLLFMLPSWAVVTLIVAWPILCLLAVLVFGVAPKQADRAIERAKLASPRPSSPPFEVDVDDRWDWIEQPSTSNVVAIPERPAAEVIPIRGGAGAGWWS